MANPASFPVIATGAHGDILTNVTPDTMFGAIAPVVGPFTVPANGNVTRPEIYYAGSINSFAMNVLVQAGLGRNVNISIVPVDPIQLTEFSDAVFGQLFFPVLNAITSLSPHYQTWGHDTTSAVGLLSHAFKLRFDDGGSGQATSVTFTLWGFAAMNRGLLVE